MYVVDRLRHYLRCERGFLGIGGDQVTRTEVDPSTAAFRDQHLRPGAQAAAQQLRQMDLFGPNSYLGFMNPYQSQVIDQINANFDRSRDQALGTGLSAATRAGAGRSSRSDVLQAQLAGEVERARGNAVTGALQSGFGQAQQLAALQQQLQQQGIMAPLQALNAGIGPYGQTQTTEGPGFLGGLASGLAGIAGVAGGLGFNPFGGGGGSTQQFAGFGPAGGFR